MERTRHAVVLVGTDAQALMATVMRLTGAANPTELASLMGQPWMTPSQLRKLYKWAGGDAAPNNAGTMALLRVAGLLSEPAEAADAATQDPALRLLRDMRSAVAVMVDSQAALLEDLGDVRERLELLEAARPSVRGQKRRRTG